ncbi:hypothetical protein M378DRAFT_19468 [Amanita muscaria Koide BX008]|uniref:Uncharacterized protein n=1 Tax=Amanita muscaria (strain Koide BX008) TaxID=946122 RepID=A0A0C2VYE0_AMAMK|nr:hypothetical protein M378DRAFT_19468 [Amanita muscaria Koide BX008]
MVQGKTLSLAQARMTEENETKRRKLDLEERAFRLREFEAGLISKSEYCEDARRLRESKTIRRALSPDWDLDKSDGVISSPCQRALSPDWDLDKSDGVISLPQSSDAGGFDGWSQP